MAIGIVPPAGARRSSLIIIGEPDGIGIAAGLS
jgi:hypothetical protein